MPRTSTKGAKKNSASTSRTKAGVKKRAIARSSTPVKKAVNALIVSVEKKRPTTGELKSVTRKVIGQYRTAIKNLARR